MVEVPPWLQWIITVLLAPATIAVWRWWEKRDAARASQAVDRIEHQQNADDEIRHAYMVGVAKRDEHIVNAIERMVTIQDTQMRALLTMEMRQQEMTHILKRLAEMTQARAWEYREADRNE